MKKCQKQCFFLFCFSKLWFVLFSTVNSTARNDQCHKEIGEHYKITYKNKLAIRKVFLLLGMCAQMAKLKCHNKCAMMLLMNMQFNITVWEYNEHIHSNSRQ